MILKDQNITQKIIIVTNIQIFNLLLEDNY